MTVGEIFLAFGVKTDSASFDSANKSINKLITAAKAFVGIKIARSMAGWVEGVAEGAVHLKALAAGLGTTTKSAQEFGYIAEQAGGSSEAFARGVGMFERNLRQFAAGRGSVAFKSAMRDVGLTTGQAREALTGPDGINGAIYHVADAYKRLGTSGNTAAINTALFGARNREMLSELGKGGAALRAQIEHFHAIGGFVDDKSIDNLKNFDNRLKDIKVALHGAAAAAIGAVAPALSELAVGAAKWITENRELISGVIKDAVLALGFAFKALAAVIAPVVAAIQWLSSGSDEANAALIGLGVGITSVLIPALIAAIPAIWAFLSPIIAVMLPIIGIGAAIAALAYGLIKLIKNWDAVKAFVLKVFNWRAFSRRPSSLAMVKSN